MEQIPGFDLRVSGQPSNLSNGKGKHRRRNRQMRVTAWLGIGAATLGVGALLAGGAGVAHADAGDTDGSSNGVSSAPKTDHPRASSGRAPRAIPKAGAPSGTGPMFPGAARVPVSVSVDDGVGGAALVVSNSAAAASSDDDARVGKNASGQEVSRTLVPVSGPSGNAAPRAAEAPVVAPSAAAAVTSSRATVKPAAAVPAGAVAAASAGATNDACLACWGVGASSITQGITTAVNHLFNSAYTALDGLPLPTISALLEGALTLIRRTLFFIPTGVSASQTSSELTIGVNSGSVAYFRQNGSAIQVADNPLFWGARDFVASSVVDVQVGNPGNTGCAGFIFTGGAVGASLETSGIDSINFGDGAVFGRTIQINAAAGPISLTNAVRGAQGVYIDGPVILATDVEIDAGTDSIASNVLFTGTVDAKQFGTQSLLVTALGSTEFQGLVGGQAALASLTTRGIAPLNIVQSDDTKSIPLYYMPNYDDSGKIQVKYGIQVAIGDNAPRYYVFDTGGQGFFAGYNPEYWQGVTLGSNESQVEYTSGNYYDALATTTSITIGSGAQSVTTQPIQIGAIISGGNSKKGTTFDFSNPYATPVDDRFVGDFGASWGVQPVDNQTQGLSSALFQLPGNLSTGFLVQLGPIGSDQQLTVGITDALRDQFTYAIPVSKTEDGGFYPVSGYPVLDQFGFKGRYFVSDPVTGETETLGSVVFPGCLHVCLPSLIDSGAPSTGVRWPDATLPFPFAATDEGTSALLPGKIFQAGYETTKGRQPFTWTFLSGTSSSVDAVGYTNQTGAASSTQNLNTGLNLYNDFDIMFDTAEQVIWLRPNGGQSTVNLGSVITTGAQNYGQNAVLNGAYFTGGGAFSVAGATTLAGATSVNAGAGAVTFSGTVDGTAVGMQSLTVNSGGTTSFMREVGGLTSLASIATDAVGSSASTGVVTTGSQNYADNTSINGLYQGSSFQAAQSTALTGKTKIEVAEGSSITFGGTLDSQVRIVPTGNGSAQVDPGYGLTLQAKNGAVNFGGVVGGLSPLGGLTIDKDVTATAAGAVNLVGNLVTSEGKGLSIGDGSTVNFSNGGSITGFSSSGVVFEGESRNSVLQGFQIADNGEQGILLAKEAPSGQSVNYTGTIIAGNQIYGNGDDGIKVANPVTGLTIRNNTIGSVSPSTVQTSGVHLAAGEYTGTTISLNTISGNAGSGISTEGGVKGIVINDNIIQRNGKSGVEFGEGDYTSTLVAANTISSNSADGISVDGRNTEIMFNTIYSNANRGVAIKGENATGNQVLSNAIYQNTNGGIALVDGGNGDQPAPKEVTAVLNASGTRLTVGGKLDEASQGGDFTVQVFGSPAPTVPGPSVQGQILLGTFTTPKGVFSEELDAVTGYSYITLTATPLIAPNNTSKFSDAVEALPV